MRYEIKGATTPVLEVQLSPGDEVVAESGELAWMHGPVQLKTGKGIGQSKGGFMGAAKRAISGGTFFMTSYTVSRGAARSRSPRRRPARSARCTSETAVSTWCTGTASSSASPASS